jgi:hypothetical protein
MTIDDFNRENPVRRVLPDTCWCGSTNRQADDHICAECPGHCELVAHREGRESPRDVELRRQLVGRQRQGGVHPSAERQPA